MSKPLLSDLSDPLKERIEQLQKENPDEVITVDHETDAISVGGDDEQWDGDYSYCPEELDDFDI